VHTRLLHTDAGAIEYGFGFDQGYTGGPPSTSDLATAAGLVRTAYAAHLASLLEASYHLTQTICSDLAVPTTVDGVDSTSVAGTRAGNPLQMSIAAVLSFGIARKYRGARPKMFATLGTYNDLATPQQWAPAFATAVETAWAAFQAAIVGVSFGPAAFGAQVGVSYIGPPYRVVISPTTGRGRNVGTERNPPIVSNVTTVALQIKLGSQRRRLSGG